MLYDRAGCADFTAQLSKAVASRTGKEISPCTAIIDQFMREVVEYASSYIENTFDALRGYVWNKMTVGFSRGAMGPLDGREECPPLCIFYNINEGGEYHPLKLLELEFKRQQVYCIETPIKSSVF